MPFPNRKRMMAGNWKMNHGPAETLTYFEALGPKIKSTQFDSVDIRLFLPTISLVQGIQSLQKEIPAGAKSFKIGAQNAHWETKGAFTGEVSGPMLREIGVTSTLIAHSERRQFFGETDATARRRALSLLKQGFEVIFCIGESFDERQSGYTEMVIKTQLAGLFREDTQDLAQYFGNQLVLAYEPVWAIGTGLTATPEQAEEAHRVIREFVGSEVSENAAQNARILYGGSMTPQNAQALLACPNIDGGLVGGASLKPESFMTLIELSL